MKQTRENGQKPYFDPVLTPFRAGTFFSANLVTLVLDIMPIYHNMQNQRKLMKQTRENGQNPHFDPILAPFDPILTPFDPISGQHIFFREIWLHQ